MFDAPPFVSANELALVIEQAIENAGEDKVQVYVRRPDGDEFTVKSYQVRRYGDGKIELVLSSYENFESLSSYEEFSQCL